MPSNRGTLFWLAFPGNLDGGNGELVILADTAASYNVSIPGQGFSVSGLVGPGAPAVVEIPDEFAVQSNELVEAKGIRVTATAPVAVMFRGATVAPGSSEAYLGLPVDLLGTDYYVVLGSEENVSVRGFGPTLAPSQLTFVAAVIGAMSQVQG